MGWFTRDKSSADKSSAVRSLDAQLDILASCGIQLVEGVDRRELAGGLSPSRFEADPFRFALVQMGQPRQSGSGEAGSGFLSNDVWHFDTECIEDSGAYVWIALRLAELAQGGCSPPEQLERLREQTGLDVTWLT